MCMGTHFPLGGRFGGYAFQLHLPRLPSYLEPHLDLWKLFLGFCSIYLFNHLKIFLTPSPFSLSFSLAVCVQQDFLHSDLELLFSVWEAAKHHEWAWSVVCGHCSSWKGSKGLLGLVIEESKECFPQAVSSQPWVLTSIVCPLPSRTVVPSHCPGAALDIYTFLEPILSQIREETTKSCFFPWQINPCDIFNLVFVLQCK